MMVLKNYRIDLLPEGTDSLSNRRSNQHETSHTPLSWLLNFAIFHIMFVFFVLGYMKMAINIMPRIRMTPKLFFVRVRLPTCTGHFYYKLFSFRPIFWHILGIYLTLCSGQTNYIFWTNKFIFLFSFNIYQSRDPSAHYSIFHF
jgi:hypothetical protein